MPTKKWYEEQIINQINRHGYYSYFWIDASPQRRHAIMRLYNKGIIIDDEEKLPMPITKCKIVNGWR